MYGWLIVPGIAAYVGVVLLVARVCGFQSRGSDADGD